MSILVFAFDFQYFPVILAVGVISVEDNEDLGTNGRIRSGKARMYELTADEKKTLGKKGASKRWSAPEGATIYEPEAWGDLPIIGHSVPCAVLLIEGEVIRVVSERGLIKSFGGKRGGSHWLRTKGDTAASMLPPVISASNLREFISADLMEGLATRYFYKIPGRSGMVANGVRAELYPMICDVLLKAGDAKKLLSSQDDMKIAADMLMRGLAHTGIIALVDEATGFQGQRPPNGLALILEAFIAKELQPYVPTFKNDFYEHLFRLRGLNYKVDTPKRPQYFGHLTTDIVYRRLAPGVLAELKKVVLRREDGTPKHKLFQRLTQNRGYPSLREHLGSVTSIMKLSDAYPDFINKLDRLHPRYGQMPLDYGIAKDDGKGL
ncbi:MAG: P63C domain-containing protein [Bryobacteraceae bacterium]